MNPTLYQKQGVLIPKEVFFATNVKIYKGQGLCYNRDVGTAADADGSRDHQVELPTTSNNLNFAGVAAHTYKGRVGGRTITIYEPGSVCQVAIGSDTVVNTGRLTCSCSVGDQGRFAFQGQPGRGSMIPLQTVAAGQLYEQSDGGTDAFDSTGLILTVAATSDLSVGDWLFVLAGEDDNTNAITPTAGPLIITALSSTTITIGTSQSDGGTMEPTYYAQRAGGVTCLAYLETGQESGLNEYLTPANGAVTAMVGGTTWLHGGFTPSADSTFTLADAVRDGMRKVFRLNGTLGSNDFLVTVTTGTKLDGSTTLANFEMDAANDSIVLDWGVDAWRSMLNSGVTEA